MLLIRRSDGRSDAWPVFGPGVVERDERPALELLRDRVERIGSFHDLGREVLGEIKSDEALKDIPVVVLTTSQAERDIIATYKLHANCYIAKPVDTEGLLALLRLWLHR